MLANNVDSDQMPHKDQMPHYVVSDLGLHCLPMTLLQFQIRMGLIEQLIELEIFFNAPRFLVNG